MKKPSRKTLIRNLDKIVSQITIARDSACVTCNSISQPNNGHVFGRGSYNTRWDVTPDGNCHRQCYPCNFKHTHDTYPYFTWYINKFGQDKFDELHRRFCTPTRLTNTQLQDMLDKLTSGSKIKE